MIAFDRVEKTFKDGTAAVNGINFHVNEGEFFVLIGPSGSGKTTALKMINRLIDPTAGHIYVEGTSVFEHNLKDLRYKIGYVLQQIALFPHMTIKENIGLIPEMKKWPQEKIDERIDELMTMVGLEPKTYKNRRPAELSGGQQQRVGVIRALAGDPDILLMDEPFSALDPITREQLQNDLVNLQKNIKKTIVFVTHDINEAMLLGSRICVMNKGEIAQIATPDNLIRHPQTEFVRSFIGDRRNAWEDPLIKVLHTIEGESDNPSDPQPDRAALNSELTLSEAVKRLDQSFEPSLPVYYQDGYLGELSYKRALTYLRSAQTADKRVGGTIL
ncbi:ABC transporter ATP-binding protein [Salisediminibacterium halotolerans]|uniref:Carnitine transport ATP-binding protein OpuCA n=1 Tax=Salisediminibacterium halotolerans TaxID=517425 RepID=A0A1H9RT11_9BACI|nr:ABC transporter ATP-binding protein [Salisediminibacterium haloalkalitolerans]SER75846.1 osmoprotectant transport system ATP-binding protein [Salisediminibacterium haloalkalitolerans]